MKVFFCSAIKLGDARRTDVRQQCLDRWLAEPSVCLTLLTPSVLDCSDRDFQKMRRVYADRATGGEPYILTDDDMLIEPGTIRAAFETFLHHHLFAILSLWPANANIMPWTPEGYKPIVDDDVMEHVSVGGVRLCRKFKFAVWPNQTRAGYDTEQCQVIRDFGSRVGYLRKYKALHLGEGCTTL